MSGQTRISVLGRREFIIGAGAAAGLGALVGAAHASEPTGAAATDPAPAFEQALDKILGEAKPTAGKVLVEMPEIAENGNTVPYAITIESP
ncbi:MAG: thiosulfate oxidation carrier protein SoxY, partial [Proteobacteria bacterium]|nr:thiosulfate oxidation carrier protein SoxY [Pseudomonadota bacterium]